MADIVPGSELPAAVCVKNPAQRDVPDLRLARQWFRDAEDVLEHSAHHPAMRHNQNPLSILAYDKLVEKTVHPIVAASFDSPPVIGQGE